MGKIPTGCVSPLTRRNSIVQDVCGKYSHEKSGLVGVASGDALPNVLVMQVSAAMSLVLPAAHAAELRRSQGIPPSGAGSALQWFGDAALAGTPHARDAAGETLDMRQFRHQTKNALQRILGVLMATPQDAGGAWIEDVARRIRLSAEISNALFGLTQSPGPMQVRLERLAAAVVALMSGPGQVIGVQVLVDGDCPAALRCGVIQVAHELIANAMKHGFHARAQGTLRITLSSPQGLPTRLLVSDDGWGLGAGSTHGEGLGIAEALALRLGGTVRLRWRGVTEAELLLPGRPGAWAACP